MARQAGTDQDLLAMALVGYEAEVAKITEAIRDIQAQLGNRAATADILDQENAIWRLPEE